MLQHVQHPPGLSRSPAYSHVVCGRGTTVWVSGQVAFDAEGRVVGAGDLAAQTAQAFANLERALAAAGARLSDIAKLTIFVVGYEPAHRAVIAEVRSRVLGSASPPPASTLVGVQALVVPELLIEIEAVAVIEP